jgi:general stress protein YciG
MYLRCSKNVRFRPELSKLSAVVQVSRLIAKEAEMATSNSTSKRGFASMDEERQREIASKGGKSGPAEKRSFSQDRELASEAGRKGGQASGSTRNPQD